MGASPGLGVPQSHAPLLRAAVSQGTMTVGALVPPEAVAEAHLPAAAKGEPICRSKADQYSLDMPPTRLHAATFTAAAAASLRLGWWLTLPPSFPCRPGV